MVIIAVLGLIQPAEFVRFWRLSKPEFWVAAVTAVTGLFFGLLAAVLVGVLLTLLLVIVGARPRRLTELQPTGDGDDSAVGRDRRRAGTPGAAHRRPALHRQRPLREPQILAAVDAPSRASMWWPSIPRPSGSCPVTVIDELPRSSTSLGERGVALGSPPCRPDRWPPPGRRRGGRNWKRPATPPHGARGPFAGSASGDGGRFGAPRLDGTPSGYPSRR